MESKKLEWLEINYTHHQKKKVATGNNYNMVDYDYYAKTSHPRTHRNITLREVLLKTGLKQLSTVRHVYTAYPKQTVHSAKSMSHFSKQAQSTIQRPFYKKTTLTNRYCHQKINTVRPRVVNTARPYTSSVNTVRPRVVNTARPYTTSVNTVRGKGVNVVKTSACWVWKPTRPNGASLGNPQLNDKGFVDSGCSRHMTGNIAYLSNFKEFDGGRVTFKGGAYGGRITGKGKFKKVRTLRYLSLVVPLKKVGDEAIHKELGDRMERAATTASSLEVEQDSGDYWSFNDNAAQLYLTAATAKVKKVNDQEQIQPLVDKQKIIITEDSIRRDLKLDDAEGSTCLPNATIFDELARMGAVTLLFDTMMAQTSEEMGEDSVHQADSIQIPIVLNLQKEKDAQAKEIATLKKTVKKLEKKRRSRPAGLRRLKRIGAARRSKSSKDKDSLGDQKDSSKQGRKIEALDADNEVTLVDDTQREDDADMMFDTSVLEDNKLTLAQTLIEIAAKSKKVEAVTTTATSVTIAAVTRPKAKGIVFYDHEQTHLPTISSQEPTLKSKDKGKAIMIEPERPLKRKDHIVADEELARKLNEDMQAELEEEKRIRRQKEEEANIALIES
ncbi:hypothetical protein Tco_0601261 [Tanacetum coccineum]